MSEMIASGVLALYIPCMSGSTSACADLAMSAMTMFGMLKQHFSLHLAGLACILALLLGGGSVSGLIFNSPGL